MGKAEVGSTKYIANRMKAKGLQRLRWYCQICERQMRDENGFKQHTMSEGHVRNMQLVGEDPRKFIRRYSADFKRDFLQLLRTAHGEKPVHVNRFYSGEYITNKEHVHMNATQWNGLAEFAKFLGREGIVRVSEEDDGLYIAWIDNSPDKLRRQDTLRKQERQERGDEEREKREIEAQVRRAHEAAVLAEEDEAKRNLERADGELITLNFGPKLKAESVAAPKASEPSEEDENADIETKGNGTPAGGTIPSNSGVKIAFGASAPKPKNIFAAAKKNSAAKSAAVKEPAKKMSEAERIMKQELDRKRKGQDQNGPAKKMRFAI
jgi:DNA/RNA-binding protein KIN17